MREHNTMKPMELNNTCHILSGFVCDLAVRWLRCQATATESQESTYCLHMPPGVVPPFSHMLMPSSLYAGPHLDMRGRRGF
jgi:hypothetical protein